MIKPITPPTMPPVETPKITTGKYLVLQDELYKIIRKYRQINDEELLLLFHSLNKCLAKFEINTPLRICHFLGQVMHESMSFRYAHEIWQDIPAQLGYEGRKDLGNTELGDGKRFMGRGFMQITGRANYQQFKDATGIDVIKDPFLLEYPPANMYSAGWFWQTRRLNRFADKDMGEEITYRVNGSRKTHPHRQPIIDHCKAILIA